MKILRDLTYFEVHLDDREDITDLISMIPIFQKTYDPDKKIWYIKNSNLEYFLKLIKQDEQYSLFD